MPRLTSAGPGPGMSPPCRWIPLHSRPTLCDLPHLIHTTTMHDRSLENLDVVVARLARTGMGPVTGWSSTRIIEATTAMHRGAS